jgi:hypothetical protein
MDQCFFDDHPDKKTVYPNLATFCSLLDVLDRAELPDDIMFSIELNYLMTLSSPSGSAAHSYFVALHAQRF